MSQGSCCSVKTEDESGRKGSKTVSERMNASWLHAIEKGSPEFRNCDIEEKERENRRT